MCNHKTRQSILVVISLLSFTLSKYTAYTQTPITNPSTGNTKPTTALHTTTPPSNKTIDLSGKVIDAESNAPVPFANIQIIGTQQGAVSNEDGFFILKNATLTRSIKHF